MDKLYFDRTFNGQDWFSLRQKAIKRDYKTTEEVYQAIRVGIIRCIVKVLQL